MVAGHLDIDESLNPVIVFTFHGVFTDAYFDEYLRKLTTIAHRPGQRALIYDIRDSGIVPAHQRRKQADWIKRYELLSRASTVGMAFVLDSPVIRGVLTAILWLAPMPYEHTVEKDMGAALTWCRGRLELAGNLI